MILICSKIEILYDRKPKKKKKENFSFKYQRKQCRSKNESENDLKAAKGSVQSHDEENICGSPRIRMGHK